jgi:hypothetical protein
LFYSKRSGSHFIESIVQKASSMIDQSKVQALWGGVMWGDCVGRFHRSWTASAMDGALGEDFFTSFVAPGDSAIDWHPRFRAIEPVQRRAFVELGLLGHASQLTLFTASILSDRGGAALLDCLEEAMSRDGFRLPNSELVETMYRMCRADQEVDPKFAHLFFPSILYLCLRRENSFEPAVIETFRPFTPAFKQIIDAISGQSDGQVLAQLLNERLVGLFGSVNGDDGLDISPLSDIVSIAQTPEALWRSARPLLQTKPYIGSILGCLAVVKFGSERVVAWNRLRAPEALETLVSNRPIDFETRLAKERELTQNEAAKRESYLAERRADVGQRYK